MSGMIAGFIGIVFWVFMIGFFIKTAARRGAFAVGGPALVLRRFHLDQTGSAPTLLEIAGRPSGFMNWLLTVIGIEPETSLRLTRGEIKVAVNGLFGEESTLVPLRSVASARCGFAKPAGWLALAIFFGLGGTLALLGGLVERRGRGLDDAWVPALISLVIAAVFAVVYALGKKVFLAFETEGGSIVGLRFKRSVVENVSVDIEQARQAVEYVNWAIAQWGQGRG